MLIRNSTTHYGIVAQLFHWAVVGFFAYTFYLGFTMVDMVLSPAKFDTYALHKSFGVTILSIMVLRLAWRLSSKSPELPEDMPAHERIPAHAAHFGLYVLLLGLPITGLIMSSAAGFPATFFGLFNIPNLVSPDKDLADLMKEVHEYVGWTAVGLIALHVAGALKHHFIDKNDILKRMLIPAKGKKLPIILLALLLPGVAMAGGEWVVDKDKSRIGFEATWSGSPVPGKFTKYEVEIVFDKDDLDDSRAKVEIDMTSVDTEYRERDIAIISIDWFDSKKYPTAIFETESFEYIKDNNYLTKGTLTLHGEEKEIELPFVLEIEGDKTIAHVSGEVTVSRLEFGIGQGEWRKTDYVGDEVKIIIDIYASQE